MLMVPDTNVRGSPGFPGVGRQWGPRLGPRTLGVVSQLLHQQSDTALPVSVTALKEWGAAIHALLLGRQQILLRKGGIHERAFQTPAAGGGFVLFPTVAHTHAERTRPEHHDLLAVGDADARPDSVTIRAGVAVVDVIAVTRPDRLPDLSDLHIWTDESIQVDRVDFRPRHPLQVLVVQAIALPRAVELPRLDSYGGCKSWIDVALDWSGEGPTALDRATVVAAASRVRDTVG